MASKSSGLPAGIDPALRRALETMREAVEQGEGHRGDPLMRNLKVQDVIDLGLAELLGGRGQQIVSGRNLQPKTPPGSQVVPPKPTGLEANAGVFHILLTWDVPYDLYSNHGYTEVWRNTTDNRANAVLVAQTDSFLYPDMDVSFGTSYYYWIRFISDSNVTGPFNAANGVLGEVSQNPQELLDRLNGEITESQLYQDLNTRIDLIDGPESLTGSVNQRIQVTEDGLAQDISQLSTTVDDNTATIQTQAQSIDGLEASYTVKVDINGQVAGYGLSVNGNDYDDTVDSTMLFSVDTFAVGAPGANELAFIVDNGDVVMDAAYIVNLVVNDADIVDLDVQKITGLDAEVQNIVAQSIFVEDLEGDVNSTETVTNFSVNLTTINQDHYKSCGVLTIPSQTRPRIPILFARMEMGFSQSDIHVVSYWVYDISDGGGSYTNLDTPDSGDSTSYLVWDSEPAGWSQISSGSEIASLQASQWQYGRVSSKEEAQTGPSTFEWRVYFNWVVPATIQASHSSFRVRNGSNRFYNDQVASGQTIVDTSGSWDMVVSDYVASLPRTSSPQEYELLMTCNNSADVDEAEFTAVLMR